MNRKKYFDKTGELREWLKECREERGLTMRDLGKKLKVHHSLIGRIESGEKRLDVAEYEVYCRAIQADSYAGLKKLR